MRFHCSRIQWRRALHHSSQRMALCMVILGLCAAAQPWKHISWSSPRTVIVQTLLPEAVWNSVVSVASYALQHSAGPFCELVCPTTLQLSSCCFFHFTALTVDRGSSHRAEIWWTDLLERWRPMTLPHWKSLSSSVWAILLPMVVYGDCMAVCLILYTCQQRVENLHMTVALNLNLFQPNSHRTCQIYTPLYPLERIGI
jgi:hypothetical protein